MKYTDLLSLAVAVGLNVMTASASTNDALSVTNTPTAPALTESERAEKAAYDRAMEIFLPAMDAQDIRQPVDFPALRAALEKYWAEAPNAWRDLTTRYMTMFARAHSPERVQAEWASFTNSPSPMAAELARGKVRFAELSRQPFELEFKALDGRVINLRTLRGKVVLIDFWATWCTPCVQQLPALKRLYSEYHEKGFEIIGVSLDRDEDKPKLVRLIAQQALPWPQHFDGKIWQNEIAVRYAVHAAPTLFLLDKEGRLAGINIEERKLEGEVKRLLAQLKSPPTP